MDSRYCSVNGRVWQGKYGSGLHSSHFKNVSNMETALLPVNCCQVLKINRTCLLLTLNNIFAAKNIFFWLWRFFSFWIFKNIGNLGSIQDPYQYLRWSSLQPISFVSKISILDLFAWPGSSSTLYLR